MPSGVELVTAWARIVPTMTGVQGEVAKSLTGVDSAMETAGKTSGHRFSSGMKVALLAGAAAVTAAAVKVFNVGFEEISFGEKLNAQTDILVKNTGFAMATGQINAYTLALSRVSGISEEDLQAAGNELLKFGDLSETSYKRAVDSINDMGAAGKDVSGVSVALGKALAEPANAAGLLKRQGVILNEEQQKLIDNFIATGDKAGAQGVILDSLSATYDGMAEKTGSTMTGNLGKLNNAFENLSGDLVASVMPALMAVVVGLQGLVDWIGANTGTFSVLAGLIAAIAVAVGIYTVVQWALNSALLASPLTWIILGIMALIAAVLLLIVNWDSVVKFVKNIWQGFINWIVAVIAGFIAVWNGYWSAVSRGLAAFFTTMVATPRNTLQGFLSWITGAVSGFNSWWSGIWSGVGQVMSSAFQGTVSVITGIFNNILSTIKSRVNGILSVINGMIGGLNSVLSGVNAITGSNLKVPKIPGLATGGTVTRAGTVLVGERGPELLHLDAGAQVEPLDHAAASNGARPVVFNNFANLGQTAAQSLSQFANRAGGL